MAGAPLAAHGAPAGAPPKSSGRCFFDGRLTPVNPAHAFDLIVTDAGSAGLAAARRSAELGTRTLLIDRAQISSTCVNRGCVPKKLLGYGAAQSQTMVRCLRATHTPDAWANVIARMRTGVARLYKTHFARLVDAGVQWLSGMASLRGRGIVRVQAESGKTTLRARQTVLAAGTRPTPLPVPSAELAYTSDNVFGWDTLPTSLIIADGGVIAVEMAPTLARSGVRVTMLTRDARVLPEFDVTVAETAALSLAGCGVDLILNADVVRIEYDAVNGSSVAIYASTEDSDAPRVLRVQRMLSAIGRTSNIVGLGLEAVGVTFDVYGRIAVDRHFRTRARGVHTVRDICGDSPLQLTPVVVAQGRYVAERLFGKGIKLPDMNTMPVAMFCDPVIAGVGLTEADARVRWPELGKRGPDTDKRAPVDRIDIVVRRSVSLEQRLAGSGMESLIKLVCNACNGHVFGAHIVDNAAPGIIQAMAVAVRMGVRLKHLQSIVGFHPTVAEGLPGM